MRAESQPLLSVEASLVSRCVNCDWLVQPVLRNIDLSCVRAVSWRMRI